MFRLRQKQVFTPQESLDHPFDVTLVVQDEKEFKAHRRVLSKASPFFEKLLNSDMRESNEGVVRLEMLTEPCLRDILEFIYTGSVQISAEDNAQDLIAMADYLVLPHLKALAEKYLINNFKLNDSNSISTYYFAERYRCENLISVCKDFILANFTAVAKTEVFLNLSSTEVKMWISSDEINVRAEEDVFMLILTWVDREKSERRNYFAELFREVRLVYVSRDYLLSDIVTNDLVIDNEGCMDLVKDAMIDYKNCHRLYGKPRKSLTTPVIVFHVVSVGGERTSLGCYSPREDAWSPFCGPEPPWCGDGKVIGCHDEVYFIPDAEWSGGPLRFWACLNSWKSIPYEEQRIIRRSFIRNEDEIYVLSVSKLNGRTCHIEFRCCEEVGHGEHVYFITKYKPESNSWEDITSFDMGSRVMICVVAKDNFIYFLGGLARSGDELKTLADADRYDLNTNTWGKIADMQVQRRNAYGAVAYGKIFTAGGTNRARHGGDTEFIDRLSCEVYSETANEWHLIQPSSLVKRKLKAMPLFADGKLFVFEFYFTPMPQRDVIIECYDPDSDLWKEVTQLPLEMLSESPLMSREYMATTFSMRVLKEHDSLKQALLSEECSTRSRKRSLNVDKWTCTVA